MKKTLSCLCEGLQQPVRNEEEEYEEGEVSGTEQKKVKSDALEKAAYIVDTLLMRLKDAVAVRKGPDDTRALALQQLHQHLSADTFK